jgi:GNAT superfamily N-acetyltransferase
VVITGPRGSAISTTLRVTGGRTLIRVLGTAVRPDFRGQGIATALKVRAITDARDRGVTTVRTLTGNPAMLRVNERLGFRTTSTEIRLIQTL